VRRGERNRRRAEKSGGKKIPKLEATQDDVDKGNEQVTVRENNVLGFKEERPLRRTRDSGTPKRLQDAPSLTSKSNNRTKDLTLRRTSGKTARHVKPAPEKRGAVGERGDVCVAPASFLG